MLEQVRMQMRLLSGKTHGLSTASVIHCMPKHSLQASVCVFSDRMMAHLHFTTLHYTTLNYTTTTTTTTLH